MVEIETGRKVYFLLAGDEWVEGVFIESQELAGQDWLILEIEDKKNKKTFFRWFNPGFICEIQPESDALVLSFKK